MGGWKKIKNNNWGWNNGWGIFGWVGGIIVILCGVWGGGLKTLSPVSIKNPFKWAVTASPEASTQ